MSNFFWILTSAFQTVMTSNNGSAYICLLKGSKKRLYLFVQVIATFSVENSTFKLRHYLIIGWGIPLMIIILWSTLTANSSSTIMSTWLNYDESNLTSQKYNYQEKNGSDLEHLFNDDTLTCPFIDKNSYEWIYTGPVIVVLMLNSFFLVWIMWVVITKLRSPNCSSEDNNHQHWKATKALLVIIPLLGITYMITIYAPSNGSVFANVLQHIRALLLSTQGFAVTLPYCFLNTEFWCHSLTTDDESYEQCRSDVDLVFGSCNAMITTTLEKSSNKCMLCDQDHQNLQMHSRPTNVAASYKRTLQTQEICIPKWEPNQECQVICRKCSRSKYQTNHSPLTCPKKRYKSSLPYPKASSKTDYLLNKSYKRLN
ncbi:CRHR1 [Lepeophtheirus salmonis]|uniref:CRHR1 n=1 Tax=Lepeophtheirus salmonis TaxID=72036 RepID=A0A7R8H2T9_LEPSM|nr:CRHR1 [Lepeophtheirus salmonis]CAF2820410.1 CRHR1 [Lepeophtheirus salmonis]